MNGCQRPGDGLMACIDLRDRRRQAERRQIDVIIGMGRDGMPLTGNGAHKLGMVLCGRPEHEEGSLDPIGIKRVQYPIGVARSWTIIEC